MARRTLWRSLSLVAAFFLLPACWEASDDEDAAPSAATSSSGDGEGGGSSGSGGGWHHGGGGGHGHHGHDDDRDARQVVGWLETLNPGRPDGLVIVRHDGRFVAVNRESDGVRRWTSDDALTWSFDALLIADPSVVPGALLVHDGAWRMWYTRDGDRPSIGLATSADGLRWSLRDDRLVGGPPGAWDALGVRRPSVLHEDGRYRMIFTGLRDGFVPSGAAGYAESVDGIHWSRHPGPVLQSADPVNDACVLRDGDRLRLWYDTRPGRAPSIVQASSIDGIQWTVEGVVLQSDGLLPDRESPFVMRLDGRLRMWLRWGIEALGPRS